MKEKNRKFFFVTTVRCYKDGKFNDCRCIGFYPTLKDARCVVTENWEALAEAGWYQYAVIEKFGFGWYPYTGAPEEWYQFTKTGVKKIAKPKRWEKVGSFGIG